MVAIGGVPGRGLVAQGYGYPAPPDIAAVSTFTKWRANTETTLATLAAKADMQARRIAALEASQANRRADALDVARALAGLFSYALQGRADGPRVALPKASRTFWQAVGLTIGPGCTPPGGATTAFRRAHCMGLARVRKRVKWSALRLGVLRGHELIRGLLVEQ
jgi:hypothetical protein